MMMGRIFPYNVFCEIPDGKRSVRCPEKRWKDAIREDLEKKGVRQWEMMVQDTQECDDDEDNF